MSENPVLFQEITCYARALKKEGAPTDGDICQIKESDCARCRDCRQPATPLYSKKYWLITAAFSDDNKFEHFCEKCRVRYGKCFICRVDFDAGRDLSNVNKTQIMCKDCQ